MLKLCAKGVRWFNSTRQRTVDGRQRNEEKLARTGDTDGSFCCTKTIGKEEKKQGWLVRLLLDNQKRVSVI